ncbi:Fumigaclavine B O-acetyltransferase easN [Apiospora arundinis]|uniref:Fumigaclavine B O-acetyltransferase easN n=1 Tax=Apiospora arundinis TaxID=335852 RepID=A0ABR2IUS5_9PEZI
MSTPLSPLDWLMPHTYIRQMLCFTSPPAGEYSLERKLAAALERMADQIPWLLSRVVSLEYPHGAVGLSPPDQAEDQDFRNQGISDVLLDVKDYSQEYSYATLKSMSFPPDRLPPHEFLPETASPDDEAEPPVFRARLSHLEGGFVLGVAVHHSTTDITGLGALLEIWAAHCRRGEQLHDDDDDGASAPVVATYMLDRSAVRDLGSGSSDIPDAIPSILFFQDDGEAGAPTSDLLATAVPSATTITMPPSFVTAIFHFAPQSLRRLKAFANDGADLPWVSTGDALTALLWSAVVAAESSSNAMTPLSSTINIPVNFRDRCEPPLSPKYLGAAFGRATVSAPTEELLSLATSSPSCSSGNPSYNKRDLDSTAPTLLAKTAAAIRRAITSQINAQSIRDAVTYTAAQRDINRVKRRPADGISMVSWADQGVCQLDWDPTVGRCEAVRLGKFSRRRYPIVLPRFPDGGLEVILSLEAAALAIFESSVLVKDFGELRCKS